MSGSGIHAWLAHPLEARLQARLRRLAASDGIDHVAVMPDAHEAGGVPVGVVIGSRTRVHPEAVGGDIGCGMATLRLETSHGRPDKDEAAAILRGWRAHIPIRRHRSPPRAEGIADLLERGPTAPGLAARVRHEGKVQIGTLGSGNHFLELQEDEHGSLWITVHSGSRGLGPAIRDHHLRGRTPGPSGLVGLDQASGEADAYLRDVAWALEFAERNRQAILVAACGVLEEVLGAERAPDGGIRCHHNHVRRERHQDRDLWVHRKGALEAGEGTPGIIPGSMGTATFHVLGRGCPAALGSSSHGAGRCMSRHEARQRVAVRSLMRQMEGVFFDSQRAARLVEEAPEAYKDIARVMRAQRDLTRIVRRLRPVLVYKGT